VQGAKDEIKKASANLRETREMTEEMEKDKLLNKKESYIIEYKNQELFINGKKQSKEVSEKYRNFFKGKNFKIEQEKSTNL
jgi:uncharacterized membrane protein